MTTNFLALIQKIESILQNWTKLGLSLLGKINILKMVIVPYSIIKVTTKGTIEI